MAVEPKLSVVIICWNDAPVISQCIESVYAETPSTPFEIILADNGSTDDSVAIVRRKFPHVRVLENRANLGFGPGNNVGIRAATGEYVLILNPDTIIRDRALDKLVQYADRHPEAGAFGCRVLNVDGSLQHTAQPAPTVWRYLISALWLRPLAKISELFLSDLYAGWDGRSEREIGFQAGCCLLVRRRLLTELEGFDERFSHQFEDADLCHRIWLSRRKVLFCPDAEITHIGGRNRGGYPIEVILETERNKYRYFAKHHGPSGLRGIRLVSLVAAGLRFLGYSFIRLVRSSEGLRHQVATHRALFNWHWNVDSAAFLNKVQKTIPGRDPVVSQTQQNIRA